MQHSVLRTLILAVVLGTFSYTIARRLKVPAILFYLVLGVLFGPAGLDLVAPQSLGKMLPTLVEIAVALILFEGAVSLPSQGLKSAPVAIRRMLLISLPLTGLSAGLLAHHLLGLSWNVSAIFGALMVVTGPSVIGPLLRNLNLSPRLEILLRYEGIWGDCIGVLAAAIALELARTHHPESATQMMSTFVLSRVGVGVLVGVGAGFLLGKVILPWVKRLGDPSLPGMVALAAALGVFWESDALVGSSGPLAATVAGFTLSSMNAECLHEVRHFKDQIAMSLISTLFVLLSASINPMDHLHLLPRMLLLAVVMGLLVRPLSVLLALTHTPVRLPERLYISAIGPRGIIAMATASYASFVLGRDDPAMKTLLGATFVVIMLSGGMATMFGGVLARLLKVSVTEYESGIVLVGYNGLTRRLADFAREVVPVRIVDPDPSRCAALAEQGLDTHCGTALEDDFYDEAAEEGFRRALVMTPNDALNVLVVQHAQMHFGQNNAFRGLADLEDGPSPAAEGPGSSRFAAFAGDFSFLKAKEALRRGEARLEVLPVDALDRDGVVPLLERTERGIKIVRAGRLPRHKTLCWVSGRIPSPVEETA